MHNITEHSGPALATTRWTVLCLDLQYILSTYLNRRYSYVKGMRLCANMLVKNVFTSDVFYDPSEYVYLYVFIPKWQQVCDVHLQF